MSIYSTLDDGPTTEMSVLRVGICRKPSSSVHLKAPDSDPRLMRRRAPITTPLPLAFKWIARLPHGVQPLALLRQFPRVANALAMTWHDPSAFRDALYDLLVDRRGGRKGFPSNVQSELLTLRKYIDDLHPLSGPTVDRLRSRTR